MSQQGKPSPAYLKTLILNDLEIMLHAADMADRIYAVHKASIDLEKIENDELGIPPPVTPKRKRVSQ